MSQRVAYGSAAKSNGKPLRLVACLLLWVTLIAGVAVPSTKVLAQTSSDAVSVYYVGPQDNVYAAILRAAPYVLVVDNPELAQVLVLNDPVLEHAQLQGIGRSVLREEVGLVLFLGPRFPSTATDIRALLGVGAFNIAAGKTNPQPVRNSIEPDSLQTAIALNSAPEVRARSVISNPNLLQPVVITAAGEPLVQRARGREPLQTFVVGVWFADISNAAWAEWPYFDYFIYRLLVEAAAAPRIIAFADYPRAPVPQGPIRWVLGGLGASTMLICLGALFMARRSLFLHPESWTKTRFAAKDRAFSWHNVGFQRPLAGLLFLLGIGPLVLLPWMLFQLQLLPEVLLPWRQAQNYWEQVGQWLTVIWVLFDAGLGISAVWHFSAWRARDAKEGLRYIQVYVWWQIVSGALQLSLIWGAAIFVLPRTAWAHLTFYVMARVLLQFPGFLMVFRVFFRAEQRFHYEQRLVVFGAIGGLGLQLVLVLLFRQVFPNLFNLDATVLSVLGLGTGLYFAEWLAFLLGMILYRHLGHRLHLLFAPTFDWRVIRRALRYGLLWGSGSLAVAAGTVAQGVLLVNSLSQVGGLPVWSAIASLTLVFEGLRIGLYDSLMPALVEAMTQEAHTLVRYSAGQALRYGLWVAAPLLTASALMVERLESGWLGSAYVGLEPVLFAFLVWAALQGPAWTAERLLEADGRPGLRSVVLTVEQALRLLLLMWLVPLLGTDALWIAFMLPLAVRTALGWGFNRRWRVKFNVWQACVAPAGAAFLVYHGLRAVLASTGASETAMAQLVWFVSLLSLMPIYGFATGILGGWDDGGVKELYQAMRLSDLGLPLASLLWAAVRLGARLSPLHGLFPVALQAGAQEEARAISMRRSPAS